MYIHQQDWAAATRVAEQNDPNPNPHPNPNPNPNP